MPSRPDLRDITTNVRDAFADADRETLLDVLTFVVKEYVVEGPPPMLVHQAETLSDLQNLSFPQLVTALQTRFDFPELAQLVVDGEQVGVRIGGVVQPLRAGAQAPAAELPRPAAGVRVVESSLTQQRPAPTPSPTAAPTPNAGAPAGSAPPPRAGLSIRSAPSPSAPAPAAPTPPAPTAAAPASPAPAAPAVPEKKEGTGDDASARFSLLELD